MAIKYKNTEILLPYKTIYLGTDLLYKAEELHTDNPIPTTWTLNSYKDYYSGNYKITASSYYSSSYRLSYAFDNNTSTWWRSESTSGDKWIKLELPEAIKVSKFKLYALDNSGSDKVVVTIQGSNDSSVWNDIGTYTETTSLTEIELTSPDYYKFYRLLFETRSSKYVAGVYEWQISEYYTK